jgi:hypothetical protein
VLLTPNASSPTLLVVGNSTPIPLLIDLSCAPNNQWRGLVTPAKRGKGAMRPSYKEVASPADRHAAMTWAQRLKRIFKIDIEVCGRCSGSAIVRSTVLLILAILAINMPGCNDWPWWDGVFKRDSVAGSRGWTGGDGALSVELPGSDDRSLWIFGDSNVTGWDSEEELRIINPAHGGLADLVFGNTIGIVSGSSRISSRNAAFYARDSNRNVVDITTAATGSFRAFFDHEMFGLENPGGALLWPQGEGLCLNCDDDSIANDKLLLSFAEVEICDINAGTAGCLDLCPLVSIPNCDLGMISHSSVVVSVDNPNEALQDWEASVVQFPTKDIIWGASFILDGPNIYVYGARKIALEVSAIDAVLAEVPANDVLTPESWRYLIEGSYQHRADVNSNPGELDQVAADVGGLFTVDKITRRGVTSWVLVHAHAVGDHFIYVRTSNARESFPAITPETPKLDLYSLDTSVQLAARVNEFLGSCKPVVANGVKDYRSCGITYHGLAHDHISINDKEGISNLVVSYIVPTLGNVFDEIGSVRGAYYRPKFALLPLDSLAPWCSIAGAECWQGRGTQWSTQTVSESKTWRVGFDVQDANSFYATLGWGAQATGDPELYIKFDGEPTATDYDCRRASGTLDMPCNLTVPAGALSVFVLVRSGTGQPSTFSLRTHHAED